uniref:Uncharacterized protein n=1 Tax=viral metagenome TaxID=1070528 RepID=A0A6M3KX46_9ZZZZ
MIKEAAIFKDGKIWTGRRHSDVIHTMIQEGELSPITEIQGFVTDDGKFVDRNEAFEIAIACGQIKDPGPSKVRMRILMSEDLY